MQPRIVSQLPSIQQMTKVILFFDLYQAQKPFWNLICGYPNEIQFYIGTIWVIFDWSTKHKLLGHTRLPLDPVMSGLNLWHQLIFVQNPSQLKAHLARSITNPASALGQSLY